MKVFWLICLVFSLQLFAKEDFDTLMGKGTTHWKFVQQERDLKLLASAKELFEQQQMAVQGEAYKIPPTVHFIWLGPRPFPPHSVENVRTWLARNPGWKFKFWTDRDRDPPCHGMEKKLVSDFTFTQLGRCFAESDNWGEKSDILRYEILLQEGGVYADHDANCLQSFDRLNKAYDFICCLETPHEPFVGRNVTCGNGVIASRPNHPKIAAVIALIGQRWDLLKEKFRGNDDYSKVEIVMQRTYIALTHVLENKIADVNDVDIIFPASYFFAKSGMPSIYSQHFYATAWDDFRERKTDNERAEEKLLYKIQNDSHNVIRVTIVLLAFALILTVFKLKRKTL